MNIFSVGSVGFVSMPEWVPFLVLALAVWSLFWKGLALWHAARRKQPWWFVALLVVNTVGVLEIIYLFAVAKIKPADLFNKDR